MTADMRTAFGPIRKALRFVTAPAAGRCLYGAHSQLEPDGNFHTYAGARVPQHLFTLKPPTKETALASHPLMVPNRANPWVAAKNVL